MESFSTRLRQAMQLRNMKSIELHLKTGILVSVISQYRAGNSIPRKETLATIAQALQVDEAWLSGHDVPMERKLFDDAIPDPAELDIKSVEQYLLQSYRPRGSGR